MSSGKKIVNILFSFVMIIGMVIMYLTIFNFGAVSEFFQQNRDKPWFFYLITTLFGIIILGALLLFFATLVKPSLKNYLVDKDKDGEIYITKEALESNVRNTVNRHGEVICSDVDVDIKKGQTPTIFCAFECGVKEINNLKEFTRQLQDEVKLSLENFTGYPVESVRPKVYDIKEVRKARVI